MSVTLPWSATPEDRRQIEASLRGLIGFRLDRVSYYFPTEDGELITGSGFESASMSVWLQSNDGSTIELFWLMDYGRAEGVGIAQNEHCSRRGQEWYELQAGPAVMSWLESANTIAGVATSWGEVEADGSEGLWSIRLIADTGACMTVALGQPGEFGALVEFQPDNLLVIVEDEVSQNYRPVASFDSAWGREIPNI